MFAVRATVVYVWVAEKERRERNLFLSFASANFYLVAHVIVCSKRVRWPWPWQKAFLSFHRSFTHSHKYGKSYNVPFFGSAFRIILLGDGRLQWLSCISVITVNGCNTCGLLLESLFLPAPKHLYALINQPNKCAQHWIIALIIPSATENIAGITYLFFAQ